MAYTEVLLSTWLTANPEYNKFPGTVSGKPFAYQASATAPSLEPENWKVWDYIPEFPDTTQSPESSDISTTGSTARKVLQIVPSAPSPSELVVFLGADTDEGIDACEGLALAYQNAIEAGQKFYVCHFMGEGKRSQVYEASVAWTAGIQGTFPDPVSTSIAITPNLGAYNKYQVIGSAISG